MSLNLQTLELSQAQFEKICDIAYRMSGIRLEKKKELVRARLTKRLRELNLENFDQYADFLERDASKKELLDMIDVLTTNKTSFFREPQHFEFLKHQILPSLVNQKKIRIWSAGCSSGEEPYSISIFLHEELKNLHNFDVKILATDISSNILGRAQQGVYDEYIIKDVPEISVKKYFTIVQGQQALRYSVNKNIRSLVRFARLNLMADWPMKGPFDVIFCRNVMIYFDIPTRTKLVNRYWHLLKPGGFLFVGHSESLTMTNKEFKYIKPAIYQK